MSQPIRRILLASLVGSTIEFFDFYTYANAAVLVFPRLFFPESDPAAAVMQSLATFAIAFFARPIGSAFFGHFGDRIGRKATLVASLLTMGISTVIIGLLPTYAAIGALFPTQVRYTGLSLSFNLAGVLGASLAPYIAMSLARSLDLRFVGYYLCCGALLTLIALMLAKGREVS